MCLKQQKSVSSQFWGWKSEIKVSAGLVSPEGLCPWLIRWQYLHMVFLPLFLCPNNLIKTPVILNWHLYLTTYLFKDSSSKCTYITRYRRVGLKHMNWEEAMIQPITSSLLIWCSKLPESGRVSLWVIGCIAMVFGICLGVFPPPPFIPILPSPGPSPLFSFSIFISVSPFCSANLIDTLTTNNQLTNPFKGRRDWVSARKYIWQHYKYRLWFFSFLLSHGTVTPDRRKGKITICLLCCQCISSWMPVSSSLEGFNGIDRV